jgi:hypothetical protein
VQDEAVARSDVDHLGQVVRRLAHVDEGPPVVVEDPELVGDAHVHRRGLQQALVEGLDDEPPGGELRPDRSVGQDHGRRA